MDIQGFSDTKIGDRTKSTSLELYGLNLDDHSELENMEDLVPTNFTGLSLEFDSADGHERDVQYTQLQFRASCVS